jgi:hypothetical protein
VCDDLGNETADFIMVQPARAGRRKRVVFIHAKASSVRRACSASDLHDVCAQRLDPEDVPREARQDALRARRDTQDRPC